jgi:hypothetical protein
MESGQADSFNGTSVHLMRNALAHVPRGQHTVVAAAIRQAFVQPDHESATAAWHHVADQLRERWPRLGSLMDGAEEDGAAPSRSGGSAAARRLHGPPCPPPREAAFGEPAGAPERGGEAPHSPS